MKFISCAVALASGILSFSSGVEAKSDPLVLWTITNAPGRRLNEHIEFKNRRLAPVGEKFFFEFHSTKVDGLEDKVAIAFDMPENGQIVRKECMVSTGNPLVPEKLADKFPDLLHFRGLCPNGEELTMLVDTTRVDGMSASFVTMNSKYKYIDNAADGTNEYVVYDYKDALDQGVRPEIDEDVVIETEAEQYQFVAKEIIAERKNRVSTSAYKFKLACIAHRTYSQFHGNTKPLVMAALITLWTRVNGVYAHEFGVFFEFVENQDAAICINGVTDSACTALANSGSILSQSANFLTGKGIPYSSYDVGHSVTTGSGGVASYPSLCTSANKARGTTGLPQPINDPFAIDYVAHEMGHQFFGPHSFMDCAGPSDGNFMLVGASEPGSASTIMGYAGICGTNNIQANSDPYFTNLNQQQMYDYVRSVQNDATCGKSFPLNNVLPTVTAPASCSIPIGNSFQLKGTTTSDVSIGSSFNWDRVDTASEDFDSTTLGKFRSWKPTAAKSRFFPNLHFLNFPTTQKVERLPSIARSMRFRFTERRLYDTNIIAPEFDLGVMGDFVYADTTVSYVSMTPLTLVSPADNSVIKSGESFTFQWTPGGTASLSSTVDLFIAENTLQATTAFDYEVHNKEFNWIKIGSAPTSAGSATFVIPSLSTTGSVPANVMVKGSSLTGAQSDLCFFFDLSTGVTVQKSDVVETASPTGSPTPAPVQPVTASPTLLPTPAPVTSSPTPFPTPAPVQPVTGSPTTSPTTGPTKAPTPQPTKFPTAGLTVPVPSPTQGPVASSPVAAPTSGPIASSPVASPTSGPVATSPVGTGFLGNIPATYMALMVSLVAIVVVLAGVLAFCIVSSNKAVKKLSSEVESEEEVKRKSVAVAATKAKTDKYMTTAVSTKNAMFSDV